MGKGPAGDRSQAKRTAWVCGPAVALDCGTNVCLAGPLATAQSGLRVLAGNDGGADLHSDDPAHASKARAGVTLFKRALNFCFQRSSLAKDALAHRLKLVDSFALPIDHRLYQSVRYGSFSISRLHCRACIEVRGLNVSRLCRDFHLSCNTRGHNTQ